VIGDARATARLLGVEADEIAVGSVQRDEARVLAHVSREVAGRFLADPHFLMVGIATTEARRTRPVAKPGVVRLVQPAARAICGRQAPPVGVRTRLVEGPARRDRANHARSPRQFASRVGRGSHEEGIEQPVVVALLPEEMKSGDGSTLVAARTRQLVQAT
jgi:hypothetical protein